MIAPASAAAPPADSDQPEPSLTAVGAEGDYLRAAHGRVHPRWTDNFLMLATRDLPATSPINLASRRVVLAVAIARDGRVMSAQVAESSSHPEFDQAAVEVLRDASPFSAPPSALLSDDGNLHLLWAFARDSRRCSGVTSTKKLDPLDVALPRLLAGERQQEALRRVASARAAQGAEPSVSLLAKAWLAASLAGPSPSVRAAIALAQVDHPAGVKALESMLNRPETAADAAAALRARRVLLCPLVKDGLAKGAEPVRHAAALALSDAGEETCSDGLISLFNNLNVSPDVRGAAVRSLGAINTPTAKKAVSAALKDPAPTVRASALLASARPGAGRPAMLRSLPSVHDPLPEIRAAAAAAIVRTGGDAGLGELYFLFKEKDPRPAEAVARELGRLSTEESARFLARLLKRPDPRVRLAAAVALASRRDSTARDALRSLLDPATDLELRAHALVVSDPASLPALAQSKELGPWAYRAMLASRDRDRAADWLLASFPELPASTRVEVLADWLTVEAR